MFTDEIRDEVQAEMQKLLHEDERTPKTLNSNTLRTPISRVGMRKLVSVPLSASVSDAIDEMIENRQGCVLVTDGGRLAGIFTERDVLTRIIGQGRDPESTLVRDVMSPDPEALTSDAMLAFAMNHMHVADYRHVPIVNTEGKPIGVLSVRDVLHYLAEFFPEEVLTLPPRPDAVPPLYGG